MMIPISQMKQVNISSEAFGLLVLYNSWDLWMEKVVLGDSDKEALWTFGQSKTRKKQRNGKNSGWDSGGRHFCRFP